MFQRLGINQLRTIMTATRVRSKDDCSEESGSLYDGEDSEGSEQEEDFQVAKGVRSHNSTHVAEKTTQGTRGHKRVVAPGVNEQQIRITRQRSATINQQSFLNLTTTTHPSSTATTNQESTQNITSATQFTSSAAAEQNYTQGLTAAAQANSPIQADISDHIADEELVPRQRSMGKQLESLSRGLGTKIPIQIYDGKRRPEPPIQVAKFASEGGIILRQHIPIFPHWKEYKKQENEGKITDYIGKLAGQFTMDVDSKAVKDACVDMIKGGQRQMRYRLKRKYFTGVPANQVRTTSPVPCMTDDQWKDLVQMWSTPNHKNNCVKNKLNCEKVQFPQCTGSQSYIAKSYVVRQEKYKDMEPSAIDLFKEMHCSKKKGFSEAVQKAIGDMEAMVATPVEDGQHVLSSTEVVSNVLSSSSKFLHNAGLLPTSKRSNTRTISTRMQELQTQLDTERQEKNGFREEMETLKAQSQASEATIANQTTEIADLKKSLSENNSLLRQILSINRGQMTPP